MHIIYHVFDDFFLGIGQRERERSDDIFDDIPILLQDSAGDIMRLIGSLIHQSMELDPKQSIEENPLDGFLLEFHAFRVMHVFYRIDHSHEMEFFDELVRKIFAKIRIDMRYQVPSFFGEPSWADAVELRINGINPSAVICLMSLSS